jgi:2-polyprenyl-3-methyl-5-hydroxy-6-metoxy-1,4-benzoquinol methylase
MLDLPRRIFSRWSIQDLFRSRLAPNFIGFDKYRTRGAYHWREVDTNTDYRVLIETISTFLQLGQSVLDIGCGDGAYLGKVAPRVGSGWGIDAEPVAIRLARRKFREHGITNCRVENLRIDQANAFFRDKRQTFDVVWSSDVIEHLPRPEELLELAVQVVKPEGLCIIGTPLYISDALVSPYHVKEFTRSEIRSLLLNVLQVEEEIILPHTRKDGRRYAEGYYLGVGKARRTALQPRQTAA